MKDGGEIDWECSKCSQQQVPSPKRDVSMFAPPFNSTWAQHLPDDEEPRLTEVSSDEAIPVEDFFSLHIPNFQKAMPTLSHPCCCLTTCYTCCYLTTSFTCCLTTCYTCCYLTTSFTCCLTTSFCTRVELEIAIYQHVDAKN